MRVLSPCQCRLVGWIHDQPKESNLYKTIQEMDSYKFMGSGKIRDEPELFGVIEATSKEEFKNSWYAAAIPRVEYKEE